MITFNLSEISPILNAELIGGDRVITSISTDTRKISCGFGCLFIAINGKYFDAHNFAVIAVHSGISAILVNYQLPLLVPQLIVKDTRQALGLIGAWIRQKTKLKTIALTGSSGKTSVKEMTVSILSRCGKVLANKGNFNNDVGVPLTLLRLTPKHDFAVIEMGANHIGEINWLTNLVKPDIALINNIYASHLAGFGSLANIAQAKGEIFSGLSKNGLGILNAESNDWLRWSSILGKRVVWRFSIKNNFLDNIELFVSKINSNSKGISFVLHSPAGKCLIQLALLGQHNIYNALAASALSLSVGASLSSIKKGLSQLRPLPGRMCPIKLGNKQILIDDSYNANVGSMIASIKVLTNMPGYQVIVLGDMMELGDKGIHYHCKIGQLIAKTKINKVFSIGDLSYFISYVSKRGEHFNNVSSIIYKLIQLLYKYSVITILVKGSRSTNMDIIVHQLQEQILC